MINYNNVYLDYVPPIDLNVANNAATNITKGHKEAIAAKSALDTFIGQLKLNESEDPYKQELKNRIQDTIDSSLIYGSDFAAGDALTALSGQFNSDNELLGKLRLNEQYQTWKDKLLANKEIDQDTKDYLLKHPDNQYDWDKFANYEIDANGNPVFKDLTPFKAGEEPTKHYSIGEIATAAVKLVRPNSSQWAKAEFVEGAGEYGLGAYVDTDSGQVESVTPQRLHDAMIALIHSDPEYMASVDQEMRVQGYTAERDGFVNDYLNRPDLYNPDGTTKTMDKYIEDKMTPLAISASYKKTVSGNKINNTKYPNNKNGGNGTPIVTPDAGGSVSTTDEARTIQTVNSAAEVTMGIVGMQAAINDILENNGLTFSSPIPYK